VRALIPSEPVPLFVHHTDSPLCRCVRCLLILRLSVYSGALGQLKRAAVELSKAWRTDKYLRRLDVGTSPFDKWSMW
jgi:hypothetical protein